MVLLRRHNSLSPRARKPPNFLRASLTKHSGCGAHGGAACPNIVNEQYASRQFCESLWANTKRVL